MCSVISAQGVAVATAVAVSGTVILLALRLQKSFPPPQFSVHHQIPPSPSPVLRSCISNVGKKSKKKKKRVHFAEDVVESCRDGEEFRKRNSRSKVLKSYYNNNNGEEEEEEAKIGGIMPANRVALYNGILRGRVAQPIFKTILRHQLGVGDKQKQKGSREQHGQLKNWLGYMGCIHCETESLNQLLCPILSSPA
ncbi:hypothetical protein JHK84_047128 [Glycine max]|nr:hypothetical protein JHK85_047693 [Glycine max]KAG5102159.1 hypothetical protein JHK84_047128 [Glycine max]